MVLVGFITLSDGIVVDSKPRNAHKVKAAEAMMALKFELSLKFKGIKWSLLKYNNPIVPNNIKGMIFRIVVMNCTFPTLRIFLVFINVKNQIAPIAVTAESKGSSFSEGKNIVR